MSGRRLDLTVRQTRAMLKAANAEHGIVEVKLGAAFVRLIPAVLVDRTIPDPQPVDDKPKGYL